MKLTDRALLVQLNISTWSANKLDKEISAETTRNKGAVSGSARVHKSLLPTSGLLDDIRKKATYIRTQFYENTLPWGVKGIQILPTNNYLDFMDNYRKEKAEFEGLVHQFVPAYPQLVEDAKALLGAAYKASDYPDAATIRERFNIDLNLMPVPNNDFRVNIGSEELERIQQEVEARVTQAANAAMKDVWQRLYDRVKHLADKLSDPAGVFRDTTVENLVDICGLLPRLNFADDPDLEDMRREVEGQLLGMAPDVLRSNVRVREDTAAKAIAIADKMSVFMQGL